MAVRVMGADHIAEGEGKFEPQRPYNFGIVLPQDVVETPEDVEMSVLSMNFPSVELETESLLVGNIPVKVVKGVKVTDVPLVCVDYLDLDIAAALHGWFMLACDLAKNKIGLMSDAKKDMSLLLKAPDDSSNRAWKMHGCLPIKFEQGELSMANRNVVQKITLLLAVDWIEPE